MHWVVLTVAKRAFLLALVLMTLNATSATSAEQPSLLPNENGSYDHAVARH